MMMDPISSHIDRYDLSGNLFSQGYIDNATGHHVSHWEYYYDTPEEKVLSKGNFYNNRQVGLWKFYNLDGSIFRTIVFI